MDLTTFWMSRYCFGLKRLCLIYLPLLVYGTVTENVDGQHAHSCQSSSCDLEARLRFQHINLNPGKQRSDHLTSKTGKKGKYFSLKDFIWKRSKPKLFLKYAN